MSQRLMMSPSDEAVLEEVLSGGGEMGALMRRFDWAATPLGPVSGWPHSLRTAVGILLNTRHPMFIWWGPELIQFYNDGYRQSLGPDRHPSALGQRGRDCWAEIWNIIGLEVESVMGRGEATWHEDHLVPITRGDRLHDVYWSYSYSPIRDDSGGVGGVLVTVQETTKRVIADRRSEILRDLAAHETEARSETEACATAVSVLSRHQTDLPYLLLYLREPGTRRLILSGASGVPPDAPTIGGSILLGEDSSTWPIEQVLADSSPRVIDFPPARPGQRPGQGQAPREALLLPLQGQDPTAAVEGVVVVGLNPRIPFDVAYHDFLTALVTQIGRGIANARTFAAAKGRAEALDLELSRLATLFEQAPGFLAVLRGPQHVFELINPAYSQLIGHRDVVGKAILKAMPEIRGQGFVELLDRVYRSGKPFVGSELQMYLQREPGAPLEEHHFNFVYQAMRSAEGEVTGVLATGYDVSEQVRARERVERIAAERDAERRQLLTVLAQSPMAIIIAEAPSGRVLYTNPKVTEVFGRELTADGVESYSELYRGFHLDGRPIESEEWPIARALQHGETVEHETITIEQAGGRRAEVTVNAAPVRNASGTIIAGVAFLWDVTAERRRDQQLRDAQRLQSVGTLAGGVAHEINNQMTVVLGFCQYVLQALGPDHPQAADLRAALHAANRSARVTHQLLAFTRLQVTQPRDVLLHELADGLAPVLRRLLGSDKILELVPSRSTRRVHADPDQIEQILINLVANARDATPTGGRVTVSVADCALTDSPAGERGFVIPAGDYVMLTVADTGRGMDGTTLARVFEPFFTTKPVGEGTGLGLSMVYGIVKQHGGFIEAESAPGEGTVIRIYWPVASSAAQAAVAETGAVANTEASHPAGTVLVVEDEPDLKALVVRALEREGYTVLAASDGEAALDIARSGRRIDAVITDIIMPRLNGRQLRDELDMLRPAVPVLFMSGHAPDTGILKELIPPEAPFLQKPFTPEALSQALAALIRRGN
jgi:PAS domain S-box-containing protein